MDAPCLFIVRLRHRPPGILDWQSTRYVITSYSIHYTKLYEAHFHLAQVSTGAGHFERALTAAGAAVPLCPDWDAGSELVGYSPRFGLLYYQAMALAYVGRFPAAHAVADEIFAFVRTRDDPFLVTAANIATTPLARLSGDLTTALARSNRALEFSEQLGTVGLRILSRLELGRTLVEREEWDGAVHVLGQLLALVEETGVTRSYNFV